MKFTIYGIVIHWGKVWGNFGRLTSQVAALRLLDDIN